LARSRSPFRRPSRLLLRTYGWGLIPILCVILYYEDGDLLRHLRCRAASLVRLPVSSRATAASSASRPGLSAARCCGEEESNAPAPVLLYSDFGAGCSNRKQASGDCNSGCVYGMNFGPKRDLATLSVGAEPLQHYDRWNDPGLPYASGRYAEICGRLLHPAHAGTVAVQLRTRLAASNTLVLTVPDPHSLVAAAHSSPSPLR